MSTEPGSSDPHEESTYIEGVKERLAAANEAIGSTRTYFFALLSIAAYIGVVVWGTTDEQLLRISPVKLPIINVEVPLTGFYTAVPVFFVLLHFNLLIHLSFTSKKLKTFLDDTKALDPGLSRRLRNDVANFPLAQWMVVKHDAVLRVILTILIWIMLVLIPPFLLLWMQLRFLSFQEELFTWLQAAAVAVDALMIVGFRMWFVRQIQPETSWVASAKDLWKGRGLSLVLWARLLSTQPLFRYLIPLVPVGLACFLSVNLSDLLAATEVESCGQEPRTHKGIRRWVEWWLCGQNRLELGEKLLTDGTLSPEIVNALRGDVAAVGDRSSSNTSSDVEKEREEELVKRRNRALDAVLGLDLRDRHLRGANFLGSLLPKSDLRKAQLQGADLRFAQLQGADLRDAQLKGADLGFAQLEGADLRRAQLEGANLLGAQLEGVKFWGAQLKGVNLQRAQLDGAILWQVQLEGADLRGAQLEDADLRGANLDWAELSNADLSFANLTYTKNLDTAELAGADYVFADGLEGTYLDINQAPPDVLPAP